MNIGSRKSVKDLVYQELKQRIIEGVLEPDQPIMEEAISQEFSVSRTPLREAISRLETEELIVRQPNGRLKVAPISIEEVKELFTVRSLLEGHITKEATLKATPSDLLRLEEITNQMIEASRNDRRGDVVQFGSEFHQLLYEISGNKTILKILEQLNDRISRYRRLAPLRDENRSKNASQEHFKLFTLITAKNAGEAEKAMNDHINQSLTNAIDSIEKYITSIVK